jgi:hypothetical protein
MRSASSRPSISTAMSAKNSSITVTEARSTTSSRSASLPSTDTIWLSRVARASVSAV